MEHKVYIAADGMVNEYKQEGNHVSLRGVFDVADLRYIVEKLEKREEIELPRQINRVELAEKGIKDEFMMGL